MSTWATLLCRPGRGNVYWQMHTDCHHSRQLVSHGSVLARRAQWCRAVTRFYLKRTPIPSTNNSAPRHRAADFTVQCPPLDHPTTTPLIIHHTCLDVETQWPMDTNKSRRMARLEDFSLCVPMRSTKLPNSHIEKLVPMGPFWVGVIIIQTRVDAPHCVVAHSGGGG